MGSEKHIRAVLDSEIPSDDSLQWVGMPARRWKLSASDGCLSLFGFLFAAMSALVFYVFWTLELEFYIWIFTPLSLFGVMWGMYMAVGRYIQEGRRLRSTYYGLTENQAVIVEDRKERRVRAINLQNTDPIELEEHKGGMGTIRFGNLDDTMYEAWGDHIDKSVMPWMNEAMPPKFENILDAHEVFELVQSAARERKVGASRSTSA